MFGGENIAKKKEDKDVYGGKKEGRTILPGVLVIFVLLIVGVTSLSFAYPGVLEPVSEIFLGDSNSQNISNNSSNSLNSSSENTSTKNDTKEQTSIPEGYSKIKINGLNAYIKNEQNGSVVITNRTEYEYIENVSDTDDSEPVELVGVNVTQLSAGNGSFFILVTNISNNSNSSNNSNASEDFDTNNSSDNSSSNNSSNSNNSNNPNSSNVFEGSNTSENSDNLDVENIDEIRDETIENTTDGDNNVNSDMNMSFLGNDIRVVHYNEFTIENFTGEMIWTYFEVNNTNVSVGWVGNTIDMDVIESFFSLN